MFCFSAQQVSFEETNTLDEFGAIHASTNPCAGKPSAAVYQIFRDTNNPACCASPLPPLSPPPPSEGSECTVVPGTVALGSSKEGNGGSMEWR